ncbi:enoyl-CoA hydratase-related protein [Hyphomonas johnsonii]|uniref:Enoyl-CoA hydratase n=1 Tax=Hyphomonas johnsonii MHS-2 TaxID=1280950 RepID=A0A059FUP6_9PROT|nr:enoyl-CoA hydratase-related protein [Hyphomonas johnsonii]KCZ94231.1 enoyl-CoA hydratase [Hyphomonas johnsonii MHS-2]
MRAYEHISYETEGHVAIITIRREASRNALDDLANIELGRAFDHFAQNDDAWVAIITGAGDKSFCAGNDMKKRAAGATLSKDKWSGGFGGLTTRHDLFKPVIAAVNGYAVGGGVEIALACDIVIAATHATFAMQEVKFGQLAGAGGAHRLPRALSWQRAMELLLTGRPINATKALDWGLVNEVTSGDDLMTRAKAWALEIAGNSPLAVRATKEAASMGLSWALEDVIDHSFPGRDALRASADFKEGPCAFAEKRKPVWTGA